MRTLTDKKLLTGRWSAAPHGLLRPTWAEIDGRAFKKNIAAIAACLKRSTKIIAVVKANAYGHMAAPLSAIAGKRGVAMLGVSSIEEGISLREDGIKAPILILGSIFPLENLAVAVQHKLIPTISSLQGLAALARLAKQRRATLPFHLKVDTGMGRVGVTPATALRILDRVAVTPGVKLEGVYMHFSAADADPAWTAHQIKKFLPVVEYGHGLGLRFAAHAANSAALCRHPEYQLDMVRPGITLYGLEPFEGAAKKLKLSPVLSWKTRIVFLKRVAKGTPVSYGGTFKTKRFSVIATLPVGYADGYNRLLSNRGAVLVGGKRCPVVGRVTMDMIMVDVTDVKGVEPGAEAVLIGTQGKERITAEEIACWCGTINYEVTCGISSRVPRIVV